MANAYFSKKQDCFESFLTNYSKKIEETGVLLNEEETDRVGELYHSGYP